MNAHHDSAKVLHLIRQAGALGATSVEIAAWSGMALGVVEAHLRTLRRLGQIERKGTRQTPKGDNAPIYLEKTA